MRKLLIRSLTISYFFKAFGKFVQIPRILIAAMISLTIGVMFTTTSINYVDSRDILGHLLYWSPFILVNLINMVYFRIYKINEKDREKGYLTFSQNLIYLYNEVVNKNNEVLVYEYLDELQEFNERYPDQDPKFNTIGAMTIVWSWMAFFGFAFLKYYAG